MSNSEFHADNTQTASSTSPHRKRSRSLLWRPAI